MHQPLLYFAKTYGFFSAAESFSERQRTNLTQRMLGIHIVVVFRPELPSEHVDVGLAFAE
jgi:hypothetical protein